MAKKKQTVVADSKPVEQKPFSLSFHAEGASLKELHEKMGKALASKDEHPKDDSADSKKRGGRRGRSGLMKRAGKKRGMKRA